MADKHEYIINLPINIEEEDKFIKQAMRLFVKEHMKQGYLEMSQINIRLSEMGLAEDIRQLDLYETKLTGCGKR